MFLGVLYMKEIDSYAAEGEILKLKYGKHKIDFMFSQSKALANFLKLFNAIKNSIQPTI